MADEAALDAAATAEAQSAAPPHRRAGAADPFAETIAPELVPQPLRFRGEAAEYFRIWIVNLALTVLTLGIYSAWAKVRTSRWFYGRTELAGTPFEYLADPLPILRGRLVAAAFFLAYLLTSHLAPMWEPALIVLLLLAVPWILTQSLRFRAHNSAWKSLRFSYVGRTRQAYVEYLLLYLPVLLSLGLAWPWMHWRQRRLVVGQHRFGGASFAYRTGIPDFYVAWLLAFAVVVGAVILGVAVAAAGVLVANALDVAGEHGADVATWIVVPVMVLLYGGYFIAFVLAQVRITNAVWNGLRVGPHGFLSTLQPSGVLWIYLTNTLAILGTIGLAIPWARVRMARYRADHLVLLPGGDLDAFVAEAGAAHAAIGQELADLFDVEVGL